MDERLTSKTIKEEKRKLWLKYKTSGLNTDKYQYRDYVNEHKKNMYEAKGRYKERLINSLKDNPKRFFNYTRMFTKSSSTIDFIEDETTHKITDPQQICDLLNDFFTSVMTKTDHIDSGIPIPGPTPETLLSDFTITEEYGRKHLRLMKWNKSSGPDEIQANVMKKCPNMIPWLCELYDNSLRTGHCPQDWKRSHVTAIHKQMCKE